MVQNIVEMQPKRRGRSFSLEVFLLLWLAIFAVMTIVVHILYEYMHQQLNEDHRVHSYSPLQTIQQPKQRDAVAIVIPYIDQPLPVWFDAFVRATKAKNDDASNITIHWLIFHNRKDIDYYNSTYVKVIHIANDELAKRFHSLFERQDSSVGWKPKIPYRMVEHKAAFGYLFRDYLHDYNYWGYGDLDILASAAYMQKSLSVIVPADNGGSTVLQSYDVITFTYGDHYSLYLRGQMTIFKKTRISMDLMWRMCTFDNRGDSSSVSRTGGMKGFQSAEGCISKVITTFYTSKNLSVLYLPLQLSDALLLRGRLQEYHSQYTLAERESLFYAGRLMKCYLNHSTVDAMDVDSYTQQYLLKPEQLHFMFVSQAKDSIYRVQFRQPRCSYWISPEYDVSTGVTFL